MIFPLDYFHIALIFLFICINPNFIFSNKIYFDLHTTNTLQNGSKSFPYANVLESFDKITFSSQNLTFVLTPYSEPYHFLWNFSNDTYISITSLL